MQGWEDVYLDSRKAAKTWRPKSGTMSPGLKRARQPYLVKNVITGIILGAFVVGVYTYSIRAVKQDEFDDIDEEAKVQAKARLASIERMPVLTVDEEKKTMQAAARAVASSIKTGAGAASASGAGLGESGLVTEAVQASSSQAAWTAPRGTRGILPKYLDGIPGLLDPNTRTLVWGAPPVDNIGTMSKRQ
ncbi:hypothetical protein D9758_004107 [Tetrapyrgos nigripes]|uniref:Cytochrome c oxidase assembly factor 3 n=1 Tax=Tetrapyrgos nigripes TaxID=182062 RepID=A0A8H5LVJ2_9AGAR|nr:hypothetical protein D9758_004107 [Tetrapyrgos nigripes]